MRRPALAVAVVCLVMVLAPAVLRARQPMEVSGYVTDTQRRPMAGALISIPALNESASSDERGRYRMTIQSRVRRGQRVVIQASREGFDRLSRPIDLVPKGKLKVNFRLAPLR